MEAQLASIKFFIQRTYGLLSNLEGWQIATAMALVVLFIGITIVLVQALANLKAIDVISRQVKDSKNKSCEQSQKSNAQSWQQRLSRGFQSTRDFVRLVTSVLF